ncbi:hypothetical protein JOE53_001292 [Microbacterium laevaniformans]|nr:hypothetical protein [Microbacterium laevaniformans]
MRRSTAEHHGIRLVDTRDVWHRLPGWDHDGQDVPGIDAPRAAGNVGQHYRQRAT